MSEIQINTTQNVNISFTAASIGERMLAFIVDVIVIIAYLSITYWLLFKIDSLAAWYNSTDFWSARAFDALIFLPVNFYSLAQHSMFSGQTIGKRLLKIRVVKIDGYEASFPDYVSRWFMRILDIYMFFGIIGLVSMIVNSRMQRLGDVVAGTSVISLKDKIAISHTILEELHDTYTPTYPSVIKLSDNDARIIKETYLAAKKSVDHATLLKLKQKIEEVIEAPSQHRDTHGFIDTILKDYNYYTQYM